MAKQKYFLLIDGHALIYRAYHAFPALTTPNGQLVNAVYGFTRHILVAIRDYEPEYIAVAFDHPKKTHRHTDFAEYKAHRAPMPEDLKAQIGIIKDVVKILNIPQFELEGYEADDLIGTLTRKIEDENIDDLMTVIVTGDRDSFQLVSDKVHAWLPGRGKGHEDKEYNPTAVKDRMGVDPEQIVDLKALMGDASDNIPGVTGIGEKTAVTLIQQFGSLDKLYEALETAEDAKSIGLKPAAFEKLKAGKESAFLSQKLATIDRNVPIELTLPECRVEHYDKQAATELFESFGFKSLLNLLPADEFELQIQNALF